MSTPEESAVERVEDAVEKVAHEVEAGVERVWHDVTTPNRCPVCDGDRIPCPDPACLDLGDDCPDCHGRKVVCENCDAAVWATHHGEIERQSRNAALLISAEDNDVSML